MKTQIKNPDRTAGLLTCLALIVYFLLMRLLNLVQIVELRGLNLLILSAGIYGSFYFRRKNIQGNLEYFNGLKTGLFTTLYAVIPFAVFIFFYLWQIDPHLITNLKSHTILIGYQFTPEIVAETILIEGIVSGVLVSFILMQYYRESFSDSVKTEEGTE